MTPQRQAQRRRRRRGEIPLLIVALFGAGAIAVSVLFPGRPENVAYSPPASYLDPAHSSSSAAAQGGTAGPGDASGALVAAQSTATVAPASSLAADGIPTTALAAYIEAAAHEQSTDPSCGLSWPLLAAIGRVESDHGRFAGAVLHQDGTSTPRIIGIPLNGSGTALIPDTDHGRLDGDTVYDRAVGPMQFIPSTWASFGVDGDGDGVADPFNIFDAAATAARYLCAVGGDLATSSGQRRAVWSYNHSATYGATVLRLEADYAAGYGLPVPTPPDAPITAPEVPTTIPPADPGTPLGASGGDNGSQQAIDTTPTTQHSTTAAKPPPSSSSASQSTTVSSPPPSSSNPSTSIPPSSSPPHSDPPSSSSSAVSSPPSSATDDPTHTEISSAAT